MTTILSPSAETETLKRKTMISARTSFLKARAKDLIRISHELGEAGFKAKQGFVFKDGREFNKKDFEQLVSEYKNLLGTVCTIPRKAQNKTQDVLRVKPDVVELFRKVFSQHPAVEEVCVVEEGRPESEGTLEFQETNQNLVKALPMLFNRDNIVPRPLLLTVVHLYKKLVEDVDNDPLFKKYAVRSSNDKKIVMMSTINKLVEKVSPEARDALGNREEEYRREQEIVSMTNAHLGGQTPREYHKEKKDIWAPYHNLLVSGRRGKEGEEEEQEGETEEGGEEEEE